MKALRLILMLGALVAASVRPLAASESIQRIEQLPFDEAYGLYEFAHLMSNAPRRYAEEHTGYLPTELSQLRPYFAPPLGDDIILRYQLLRTGKLADLPKQEWIVAEIAPPMDATEKDGLVRMIRTDDWVRVRRAK